MKKGTILISLLIILWMVFLFTQTFDLPKSLTPNVPGPAYLPRVYITLGIILCLSVILKAYLSRENVAVQWSRLRMLGAGSLILIVYILLLNVLGYFLATFLFIIALVLLMGGQIVSGLVVSGSFVFFTYVVFMRLFNLPLPKGLLF